ncbi:MAG: hypothetical protein IPK82_38425 [Polyangiaceae bacterium]|nr:hypothetical protein [Polyangiaceae bacterium]
MAPPERTNECEVSDLGAEAAQARQRRAGREGALIKTGEGGSLPSG